MEAGRVTLTDGSIRSLDLVNAISDAVDASVSDADINLIE